MIKGHILDQCPHCNQQAMLAVGEGKYHKRRTYTRYAPCPDCDGSGAAAGVGRLILFLDGNFPQKAGITTLQ